MSDLYIHNLGRIDYASALALQTELVEQVKAGGDDAPAHLLLLEHDPAVITLGRRGKEHDILLPKAKLDELGIEIHEATRGGEVTYHGPGQLVAYVIRKLHLPHDGVRDHVRRLENAIIHTLAEFDIAGVPGNSKDGTTGVWTQPEENQPSEKIAAIGVAVHRWVTYHGFALNVCTDLRRFDLIVPCGLADKGVTSMNKLLNKDVSVDEVKPKVIEHVASVFGYQIQQNASTDFTDA